jgi:hypothetical protein
MTRPPEVEGLSLTKEVDMVYSKTHKKTRKFCTEITHNSPTKMAAKKRGSVRVLGIDQGEVTEAVVYFCFRRYARSSEINALVRYG